MTATMLHGGAQSAFCLVARIVIGVHTDQPDQTTLPVAVANKCQSKEALGDDRPHGQPRDPASTMSLGLRGLCRQPGDSLVERVGVAPRRDGPHGTGATTTACSRQDMHGQVGATTSRTRQPTTDHGPRNRMIDFAEAWMARGSVLL